MESSLEFAKSFITSLEDDLSESDRVQSDIYNRREKILTKLEGYIENLPDTFPDKQGEALAQMLPVQTYASLLNDQEASITRRVNLKFKKKSSEEDDKAAEFIAEFLKTNMSDRKGMIQSYDSDEIDNEIEQEVNNKEPIKDTELREDPSDLS